jgi:hypothetical protein
MSYPTSISKIIITIIRKQVLIFNPLTNTAQVLTQNLAGRQGICFVIKYTSLVFQLLNQQKLYYGEWGAKRPIKFFSSYRLLAPPLMAPGANALPAPSRYATV